MKRTKIVYILEDGRFGGMNKMAGDLASELKHYNFDPHIIVGKTNSDFFLKRLEIQNTSYETVKLSVLSKNINALARYAFTFIPDVVRLMCQIRRTKTKLVYCNGSQQIKGVIAATLLNKIVVWHIHDTFQPKLLIVLFNLVRKVCRVRKYVASSERTITFYKLRNEDTHISLPPVDTNEFKPVHYSIDLSQTVNITTISNINTDKGLETLVKTAALLNTNWNNINFNIIGLLPETQKKYFRSILNLAKSLNVKNIRFLGQRDDIFQLLEKSALYLCTSNNESGPIAVFEAMAMGIPVVSTDVGDLKKIFDLYDCGTVQPIGDHTSLSKEIESILTSPLKQKKLSKNVRHAAVHHVDIKTCAKYQSDFLTSIISN